MCDKTPAGKADTAASVARHAEHLAETNQSDSFPPEGTDEKVLKTGAQPPELSEDVRLKATKAALDRESQASGKT